MLLRSISMHVVPRSHANLRSVALSIIEDTNEYNLPYENSWKKNGGGSSRSVIGRTLTIGDTQATAFGLAQLIGRIG